MNVKLSRLAERRERLVAQAATQRRTLAQNIEPWRMPLALADQGLTALRYIKRHPEGLIGVVVMLAALRPGRVVTWLGHGWVSWQLLQRLRSK